MGVRPQITSAVGECPVAAWRLRLSTAGHLRSPQFGSPPQPKRHWHYVRSDLASLERIMIPGLHLEYNIYVNYVNINITPPVTPPKLIAIVARVCVQTIPL
jgi:hypothetical protein